MRVASLFLLIVGASAQSLRGSEPAPAQPRQLLDAAETAALKTMFDLADTNKDGLVSFPELLMMYPVAPAGLPAVPAAPVAAALAVAAPVAAQPAVAVAAPAVPAVAAPAAAAPAAVAPAAPAAYPAAPAEAAAPAAKEEEKEPAEPEAVKLATEAAAANMAAAIKSGTVEHIEDEDVVGVVNESR